MTARKINLALDSELVRRVREQDPDASKCDAKVVEDAETVAKLMPEGYAARPEQAIVFTVEAWDTNCHQHIPQKFDAGDVAAAVNKLQARIAELEAENEELRRWIGPAASSAAAAAGEAERPAETLSVG